MTGTRPDGSGLPVRRDVALPGRPGRGRPPGYHLDRRLPWWVLAAVLAVIAGLLVIALVQDRPHRLAETQLAGTRTLTGRACIVIAADLSGSMAEATPQRRTAVAALLPWLQANLAADDVVTLVSFTDRAAITLPATAAAELRVAPPAEPALGGDSTQILPAIALAARTLDDHPCAATAIVAVSDGELGDPPDQLLAGLTQARISHVTVLNPHGDIRSDYLDQPELAGIDVAALGDSPDEISLTIATTIAELTGQHLQKTS